jgi:hypothetical protein
VDKARGPRLSVFGLLLLPLISGGTVGAAAPQPHGHWSDHLASAGAAAGQLAALAVIAALLRRRLRSSKVVLTAAVAIGLSLEVVGNSIAANSIWATPYGDEEAGVIGPIKDGFELGHTVASSGDAVAVISAVVLAGSFLAVDTVPPVVPVLGMGLCFIPPPWIVPVIGCTFVLTYYLAFSRERQTVSAPPATST